VSLRFKFESQRNLSSSFPATSVARDWRQRYAGARQSGPLLDIRGPFDSPTFRCLLLSLASRPKSVLLTESMPRAEMAQEPWCLGCPASKAPFGIPVRVGPGRVRLGLAG